MIHKIFFITLGLVFVINAEELKVYFFDIGEGEISFIRTPEGHNILINTGNAVSGFEVVKLLRKHRVSVLDAVIITNMHPDHMSGVFIISRMLKIRRKYDNGHPIGKSNCTEIMKLYADFFRKGNYYALKRGDVLRFGRLSIKVLSPVRPTADVTGSSLVLLLTYGDIRFLFTDDVPIKVENELLRKGDSLSAEVLNIGNHWTSGVLSTTFIDRVNPTFAVLSISKNKARTKQAKRIVGRLQKKGIGTYLTYEYGSILFTSDGEGLRIWAGKGR